MDKTSCVQLSRCQPQDQFWAVRRSSFSSPADAFGAKGSTKKKQKKNIGYLKQTVLATVLDGSLSGDAIPHGSDASWQLTLEHLMSEA